MNNCTSLREAIILAGGFGTRLAHIVRDVPKPMAEVAGRPFLRYLLDNLSENGFSRVVIADGYLREIIEDYFGNSYRGLSISYSSEESPLLTGGAVKKALEQCTSNWVYVFNGDTYLNLDFDNFERKIIPLEDQLEAVIAIKRMKHFDRYGSISFSDDIVTSFEEKKYCEDAFINAGVYRIKKNGLISYPEKFSLETDYFTSIVGQGKIGCIKTDGSFIDIGVPDDYVTAQTLLAPLVSPVKLAIFDRDGTINVDTGHLYEPEKLVLIEKTVDLIRHYNKMSNYKVIVATNQAGIAKGIYSSEEMFALHSALDSKLFEMDAHIDAYYYCPHHPDYSGPCNCRKPLPGMLNKALFDYEAVGKDCIMYGDKESDMLAAEAAGIPFQYVEED